MPLRRAAFSAVLLCTVHILTSTLSAQSPASAAPTPAAKFEANVRVVLVDVVVTDRKGEPVGGLQQQDFKVFENGKPQTIASFEEHKGVAPQETKLPPMPPGVFTNFPTIATADSVNVLLVDTLNTATEDQAFVRAQMLKYLKTVPPGARVAIFSLGTRLRMLQEFTSDSSELLRALDAKNSSGIQGNSPLLQSKTEQDAGEAHVTMLEMERMGPEPVTLNEQSVDASFALRELLAETKVSMAEQRIFLTLQALQQLGRHLASFPGRKNVIWVSNSFPFSFQPDESLANPFRAVRNFQEELRKTADLLTTAQVAVYPVSAAGLTGEQAYEADAVGLGRGAGRRFTTRQIQSLQAGNDERVSRRFTMEELAKDTGGKSFTDSNGLGDILARLTRNGMKYYTLSYVPVDKTADGKYRKISVEMVKEKHNLSYRRGYYASKSEQGKTAETKATSDPLLPLVGFAVPEISQIVFKVRVGPSQPQPGKDAAPAGVNRELKGPVRRYDFDFAVAPDDLLLAVNQDGKRQGAIEYWIVAYDSSGKPLNTVGKRMQIALTPIDYASLRRVGLQIHEQLDVPKTGDVHLRCGIYDLNSGKAGTIGITAREIPAKNTQSSASPATQPVGTPRAALRPMNQNGNSEGELCSSHDIVRNRSRCSDVTLRAYDTVSAVSIPGQNYRCATVPWKRSGG